MSEVTVVESVVSETVTEVTKPVKVKRNSPTDIEFALAVNASENRQEALSKLKEIGKEMTYSAFAARYKSYKAKGVAIKDLTPGKRGRKTDVAKVNAEIAAHAAVEAVGS